MTTETPRRRYSPKPGHPRLRPLALVLTGTVARRKGRSIRTVREAILDGRLPAYTVSDHDGRPLYLVRIEDADLVWPDAPRAADLPAVALDVPA